MSDFNQTKIRRLDGTLLLVFRELVRRRRATEVADELGLSPSAISHALGRLRELFEDQLFVRKPHGLEPTQRALELASAVEELIDRAGAILTYTESFDPLRSQRRFRISAPEFVVAAIGSELIERVTAAAPEISLDISFLVPDRALDAVRRGELDVAVGRFGQYLGELTEHKLYADEVCVIARAGHPRIHGRLDVETYMQLGHIVARPASEGVGEVDLEIQEWLRAIKPVAIVPRWLPALHLVAATDAVATCPRRLAERHARALGLQLIEPPFGRNQIEISCVTLSDGVDLGVAWLVGQTLAAANTQRRKIRKPRPTGIAHDSHSAGI